MAKQVKLSGSATKAALSSIKPSAAVVRTPSSARDGQFLAWNLSIWPLGKYHASETRLPPIGVLLWVVEQMTEWHSRMEHYSVKLATDSAKTHHSIALTGKAGCTPYERTKSLASTTLYLC